MICSDALKFLYYTCSQILMFPSQTHTINYPKKERLHQRDWGCCHFTVRGLMPFVTSQRAGL